MFMLLHEVCSFPLMLLVLQVYGLSFLPLVDVHVISNFKLLKKEKFLCYLVYKYVCIDFNLI